MYGVSPHSNFDVPPCLDPFPKRFPSQALRPKSHLDGVINQMTGAGTLCRGLRACDIGNMNTSTFLYQMAGHAGGVGNQWQQRNGSELIPSGGLS